MEGGGGRPGSRQLCPCVSWGLPSVSFSSVILKAALQVETGTVGWLLRLALAAGNRAQPWPLANSR